ncbi:hypothetical protein MHYP_G00217830 [Metynnis hypsauchen]
MCGQHLDRARDPRGSAYGLSGKRQKHLCCSLKADNLASIVLLPTAIGISMAMESLAANGLSARWRRMPRCATPAPEGSGSFRRDSDH